MLRAGSIVCLCALIVLAVSACSSGGSGRGVFRTPLGVFEIEYHVPPQPASGAPCGTIEIDGRVFAVFCDEQGEPSYVAPEDAPDRRIAVRRVTDLEKLPTAYGVEVEIDGTAYLMAPLPEPLLAIELTGTAAELLEQFGVVSSVDEHDVPYTYVYDEAANVLDVRVAISTAMPLPCPFEHDLQYETIVVDGPAGAAGFALHRVVGDPAAIASYVRAAGLVELHEVPTFDDGDGTPENVGIGAPSWP